MVRLKHRYILIKLESVDNEVISFAEKCIYQTVVNSIQKFHGDYGVASVQSSLSIKYANSRTQIVIIRARRGAHIIVLQCVALIQSIAHQNVILRTLHVGGSIRSCQKFLNRYNRQELTKKAAQCSSVNELAAIQKALLESV